MIQTSILTTIDIVNTPRIEIVNRSTNVPSGCDDYSVAVNAENGEKTKITASFENVSKRDITFHDFTKQLMRFEGITLMR